MRSWARCWRQVAGNLRHSQAARTSLLRPRLRWPRHAWLGCSAVVKSMVCGIRAQAVSPPMQHPGLRLSDLVDVTESHLPLMKQGQNSSSPTSRVDEKMHSTATLPGAFSLLPSVPALSCLPEPHLYGRKLEVTSMSPTHLCSGNITVCSIGVKVSV